MNSIQTIALTQLKRAQIPLVFSAVILLVAMLLASLLNISTTHPKTCIVYSAYLMMCTITVASLRQNLLHPACLFVYVSLLGFGLNIPLFCSDYFPGVHYEDEVMQGVSFIILTSTGATILGTLIIPRFTQAPKILKLHLPHPEVSFSRYIECVCAITLCGIIRITFHLGEPGVQPKLPFAGILQFVFFEGAIVVALWYLSRGLQKQFIHILYGLSLLAGIALIQSLLGWRGGVFAMLMAGIGIFILQDANSKNRSPIWLAILALAAVSLINLGNQVRAEKLGGESNYAKTEQGFITRVLYRGQGTTRLAEIVKYFGEISATNNSMYKELNEANISATTFVDRELYGVDKSQSHSVGTSGPGGPYVNFGLIGVFFAYLGLGIFFKLIYSLIWASNTDNPTMKIMYSYLILTAVQTQSENFGALQIKSMFAITVLALSFNHLIQSLYGRRAREDQQYLPQITTSTNSYLKSSALFRT